VKKLSVTAPASRRENSVGASDGDHQAAQDQAEAGQQRQRAHQAELLAEGGEDEVGGALGDELQVGLRALHEALAGDAAGADRDHALDDVEALAQRVGGRVQQGADAVLLVFAAAPRSRRAGRCGPRRTSVTMPATASAGQDQLPGQAGEEDHVEPGPAPAGRCPGPAAWRSAPGSSSRPKAAAKSGRRSWPSRFWNHQASISGMAIFSSSDGWITVPHVEPARGALLGDAEQRGGHQQRHASVERHGQRHQRCGGTWATTNRMPRPAACCGVVHEAGAVVVAGRVHADQAPGAHPQHGQQQRQVEAMNQAAGAAAARALMTVIGGS
jgi:hypothetical protein